VGRGWWGRWGVVGDAAKTGSFFEGTILDRSVLDKMGQKDFHNFPSMVEKFEDAGTISTIKDFKGVDHYQLNIPGSYGGKSGNFEFIKTQDNIITHRLFRPDK
jgi:hypothetical protein